MIFFVVTPGSLPKASDNLLGNGVEGRDSNPGTPERMRVIDVVPATATAADTYVELIVKINTHQYNSTTGV